MPTTLVSDISTHCPGASSEVAVAYMHIQNTQNIGRFNSSANISV